MSIKNYLYKGYVPSDYAVCSDCIGNESLKKIIQNNGIENTCDFCKTIEICIDFNELAEKILDGISFEYERAIEVMGIESGKYVGAMTWDSYELLDDLNEDMELEENVLIQLQQIIEPDTWCKRDLYWNNEYDVQMDLWERFCKWFANMYGMFFIECRVSRKVKNLHMIFYNT